METIENISRFSEPEPVELRKGIVTLHNNILKSKRAKKTQEIKEYISRFDSTFFKDFTRHFIIPFLKAHGYEPIADSKKIELNVKWWAGAHYYVNKHRCKDEYVVYDDEAPQGEEYDWFLHCVPLDEVMEVCSFWAEDEFLDMSECGHSQISDLQQFLWNIVDLNSSKAHQEWLYRFEDDEDEDDGHQKADSFPVYEKRKHNNELY